MQKTNNKRKGDLKMSKTERNDNATRENTLEKEKKDMMNIMESFVIKVREAMEQFYTDCRIETTEVLKNNNLKLTGLIIREKGCNVAPSIYLDSFFNQYRAGRPLAEICNEIIEIYETNKGHHKVDVENFKKFDKMRECICFKMINAERNMELLKDIPHRLYQDLAIVYYAMVLKEEKGTGNIIIRNDMMNLWETDEETLYEYAKKNTPKLLKGYVRPITQIIAKYVKDISVEQSEKSVAENYEMNISKDEVMYVVSNANNVNGAATMLYDGIMQEFAEKTGGDFYILPSSTHEVIFVPASKSIRETELIQMVREVNETEVALDEILSGNIYHYHADRGCLGIIR